MLNKPCKSHEQRRGVDGTKGTLVLRHISCICDRRVATTSPTMTIKRKRSESALDQENVSERRLQSGRTFSAATSPAKNAKATKSPSRSPRKRLVMDPPQKDEFAEDHNSFPSLKSLKTPKRREIKSQKHQTNAVVVEDKSIFMEETSQLHKPVPPRTASTNRRGSKRDKVVVEISSPTPRSSMCIAHEKVDASSDNFLLCLDAQKKEILRALRNGLPNESMLSTTEDAALNQLSELLEGSVMRAEGNSCLILGPRGSGKSRVCNFHHIPHI